MNTATLVLAAMTAGSAPTIVSTQAEWRSARAELEGLRRETPRDPRVEMVRISVRGPGGVKFDGRGAVAVAPGRALRMMLLGPAGRTALDVWATPSRYRLAIPDLDVIERGGESAPAHLPIELFREWFLAPLGGRLLAAGHVGGERFFILKGRGRSLELRVGPRGADGRRHYAIRKHDARGGESAEWNGRALWPSIGETVHFYRPAAALELVVEIEGVSSEAPDPAAFEPPEEGS